jgi:hypothetical protein
VAEPLPGTQPGTCQGWEAGGGGARRGGAGEESMQERGTKRKNLLLSLILEDRHDSSFCRTG